MQARINLSQEWPLSRTWHIIPKLEINAFRRSNIARHQGSGIADSELSARLVYSPIPEFGIYLGLSREQTFGKTANGRKEDGETTKENRILIGTTFWF